MKQHRLRDTLSFLSFALFPLTLNFFSPYVSIDGAMAGIVSGSVLVFLLMFLFGLFFGRAWCSYVCPWAAPSTFLRQVNDRKVNRRRLAVVRFSIFGVWFTFLVLGFVLAGGIRGVDPLRLTERGISVDEPVKYITYYGVLGILLLTTLLVGRRGACHTICWMSPFLQAGTWVGRQLHLPQYRVVTKPERCIFCRKCDTVCPMSIDVSVAQKEGAIRSYDCILCGNCADVCPKAVLDLRFTRRR